MQVLIFLFLWDYISLCLALSSSSPWCFTSLTVLHVSALCSPASYSVMRSHLTREKELITEISQSSLGSEWKLAYSWHSLAHSCQLLCDILPPSVSFHPRFFLSLADSFLFLPIAPFYCACVPPSLSVSPSIPVKGTFQPKQRQQRPCVGNATSTREAIVEVCSTTWACWDTDGNKRQVDKTELWLTHYEQRLEQKKRSCFVSRSCRVFWSG